MKWENLGLAVQFELAGLSHSPHINRQVIATQSHGQQVRSNDLAAPAFIRFGAAGLSILVSEAVNSRKGREHRIRVIDIIARINDRPSMPLQRKEWPIG